MQKKTGIVLLIVGGTLVACCGGGILMLKSAVGQLQDMSKMSLDFTRQALTETASTWDAKTFTKYSTSDFKGPANIKKTEKMFMVFYQKLGKLTVLEEVKLAKGQTYKIKAGSGEKPIMTVSTEANAKFEKGSGKFLVNLVATKGKDGKFKYEISYIKLLSDKLFDMSDEDIAKAKSELKKDTSMP